MQKELVNQKVQETMPKKEDKKISKFKRVTLHSQKIVSLVQMGIREEFNAVTVKSAFTTALQLFVVGVGLGIVFGSLLAFIYFFFFASIEEKVMISKMPISHPRKIRVFVFDTAKDILVFLMIPISLNAVLGTKFKTTIQRVFRISYVMVLFRVALFLSSYFVFDAFPLDGSISGSIILYTLYAHFFICLVFMASIASKKSVENWQRERERVARLPILQITNDFVPTAMTFKKSSTQKTGKSRKEDKKGEPMFSQKQFHSPILRVGENRFPEAESSEKTKTAMKQRSWTEGVNDSKIFAPICVNASSYRNLLKRSESEGAKDAMIHSHVKIKNIVIRQPIMRQTRGRAVSSQFKQPNNYKQDIAGADRLLKAPKVHPTCSSNSLQNVCQAKSNQNQKEHGSFTTHDNQKLTPPQFPQKKKSLFVRSKRRKREKLIRNKLYVNVIAICSPLLLGTIVTLIASRLIQILYAKADDNTRLVTASFIAPALLNMLQLSAKSFTYQVRGIDSNRLWILVYLFYLLKSVVLRILIAVMDNWKNQLAVSFWYGTLEVLGRATVRIRARMVYRILRFGSIPPPTFFDPLSSRVVLECDLVLIGMMYEGVGVAVANSIVLAIEPSFLFNVGFWTTVFVQIVLGFIANMISLLVSQSALGVDLTCIWKKQRDHFLLMIPISLSGFFFYSVQMIVVAAIATLESSKS